MELDGSREAGVELQRIFSGFLARMFGFERSIWLVSKSFRGSNSGLGVGGVDVRGKVVVIAVVHLIILKMLFSLVKANEVVLLVSEYAGKNWEQKYDMKAGVG